MEKIRIGILGPSEIASRRFVPALKKLESFEYIGLAQATEREYSGNGGDEIPAGRFEKANRFIETHGGKLFKGYENFLSSDEINAVYIPLPPALHFKWAKKALENGKNVLLEKPFTTSLPDTDQLLKIAKEKDLAIHENYMFAYHSQLEWIKKKLSEGVVGDIRLIRIDFGFQFLFQLLMFYAGMCKPAAFPQFLYFRAIFFIGRHCRAGYIYNIIHCNSPFL